MQKPITNLERNNYNTNYKTKHKKHQKIINKELDLLLKILSYYRWIIKDVMKRATDVEFVCEF